jgi:two-component system NtrC family sensor kinase
VSRFNDSPLREWGGAQPEGRPEEGPRGGWLDADSTASPFASYDLPQGSAYFQQLRRRLRWRLLIAYIAPFVLLSIYFHLQYTSSLRVGIDTHLKSIADNQRNTVDLYLQTRAADLLRILQSLDPFESPPEGAMQAALEQLQADSSAFVDVGLFGRDGTLVAYAGPFPHLQGRSYAGEEWFTSIRATDGTSFISDVYLGFRGKPHFIIAVTRDVAGRSRTLRASLDPEEFSEFVGSSLLITEADAFIVNRDGRPQTLSAGMSETLYLSLPEQAARETVVDEMAIGGSVYLTAVAPLRKSDWFLVVRAPKAQAYAPVRRAGFVIGGLMSATLLIVVFAAYGSTQKLVGRLAKAESAQEQLRRQLFNAAKLASVGEMAAGVAHEINNPLAIIYEEAGMLQDRLDPRFGHQPDMDEFRERLQAITEATLRGRNITRQLLAFSRRFEPEPVDLDLNEMVRAALAIKQTEFAVSNIEIETVLEQDLPNIHVDRNQMEQVLLNLLNNARDAIGQNGRIRLATSRGDRLVQLRVTDDGRGMPPELMERIFFPFFTTKEVGKGTGLGLSISYGIVKSAGGRIEVSSEVGKGTTFIVTLPTGAPGEGGLRIAGDRGNHG